MFNNNMKDPYNGVIVPSCRKTSSLTSLCTDISPSSSHFFEVLYIGKVRAPHKKVPDKFIDFALGKFRRNELERYSKNFATGSLYEAIRRPSQDIGIKLIEDVENNDSVSSSESRDHCNNTLAKSGSAEDLTSKNGYGKPENLSVNGPKRPRSGSLASTNGFSSIVEHNRTMVFQVGRTDLRLISPDRKQILLHKQLKELIGTTQGIENPDHFAIICRDSINCDSFVGYVFKCESESVASEVIGAISRSHFNAENKKRESHHIVVSCEHCPIVWFRKLCSELEGIKDDLVVQVMIFRKMEELPEDEKELIMSKLHASEALIEDDKEQCSQQNKFLLMLLKAHCEGKQSRHIHDTVESRHEFLNNYLGGSKIFMKAKRSLTNSFDQLLKRKPSKDDIVSLGREPANSSGHGSISAATRECSSKNMEPINKETSKQSNISVPATTALSKVSEKPDEMEDLEYSDSVTGSPKSMMNIFLKVGNSPKSSNVPAELRLEDSRDNYHTGSWRQAIFKNVNTPQKIVAGVSPLKGSKESLDYKSLWKKAINQQVLLIRMERENAKLHARQEEATVKRIKLEYDDISPSSRECLDIWDTILKDKRKYDDHMLLQAVRQGVPRTRRGDVWLFLTEHYIAKMPPPIDISKFPNYNIPYEQLLTQLTSQQHAILIDLGRTFPNHSYFMSPLGPGQLALYNLLKAYSLLDPEVAYCQGLSFIAGILLLHMSEDQAFLMLRHLMFRRNLRKQYLPDMVSFQIQLYQLTRLMKDTLPDLYNHFDMHEIPATLYAAPWMLTIFASQFPLGFVVRVFDLIFASDITVIFKVIISLLSYHKENLLKCNGFECIMDYLKNTLPIVDKHVLNSVIKEVYTMDISRQLLEYSVEYNVLQEELNCPRSGNKQLKEAEESIKLLKEQNRILSEQLEIAVNNNNRFETARVKYMSQINKFEIEVKTLETTVVSLGNYVSQLIQKLPNDVEVPTEILRILSQINLTERRRSSTIDTGLLSSTSDDSSKPVTVGPDNTNPVSRSVTLGQLRLQNPKNFSYFSKSLDQVKEQEDSSRPVSASDSLKNIKFERIIEESDRVQSLGRDLSDENRRIINQFQIDYARSVPRPGVVTTKIPFKSSQSSFDVIGGDKYSFASCSAVNNNDADASLTNSDDVFYPLNCGDIHISYSGATKLRTIRPARTKSECHISLPAGLLKSQKSNDRDDVDAFTTSFDSACSEESKNNNNDTSSREIDYQDNDSIGAEVSEHQKNILGPPGNNKLINQHSV